MKKKKQAAGAVLALSVAASLLAGCGQQGQADNAPGGDNRGAAAQPGAVAEYVYTAEYIPIKGEFDGMMQNVTYANGSLFATNQERYWVPYTAEEMERIQAVAEIEEETAEAEAASEEAEETAEEEQIEGENGWWNYKTIFCRINLDGSSERIPYDGEENGSDDGDGDSGSYINSIRVGADGTIYVLENTWRSWNDAPEGVEQYSDEYWEHNQYEEGFRLRCMDSDGTVRSLVDLSGLSEAGSGDDYFYIGSMASDGEGRLYLSGSNALYIVDAEGKLLKRIESENYISSLYSLPDGTVAAYTYNWSQEKSVQELCVVDPVAGKLGEGTAVPDFYGAVPGGGDYDFYYTSGINFYGYKLETGQREKLLNWLSCDVDPDSSQGAFVMDDGQIVAVSSTRDMAGFDTFDVRSSYMMETNYKNELVLLKKVPADQVQQKQILTLATQSLGYNVRSRVIDFNKSNSQYRIEVADYSEYNTGDDYTAGLTKLRTEILSGNIPDILDLSGLQEGLLANKGYLEDLYPYIDSDPELSREDLMDKVLAAFERDGKLYRTINSFTILTAMGAPELVGDKPGWTVDEFNAALAKLRAQNPEATAFNKTITRDDFFQYILALDMDSFVNWSTGETHFDSEGFVKTLEFVNSFPSDFDWDNYQYTEEDDDSYRISHGLQMLEPMGLWGFNDAYELRIYNKVFGGRGVFIGFPTAYGVGSVFQTNGDGFAITSKCSDKEGAWQFLRGMFSYSGANDWGFPISRSAFEAQMANAMERRYRIDQNGNYILDEKGERIEEDYGTWGSMGFEVPGGPLEQEEAGQILELIGACTKALVLDQTIYDIVKEGAAPYFEGQRSAEDVAKQIQSKVMIYVNEQR
ncbi:MAG: extracellular solute-binding protein [Oscillospiraceae bacterium]|nr:extracellular solute-binding protein [Oscillospiraceae bacterium]